ncbi:MAG: phosphatase PAP2 family protein [Bacteroidetes bacterium]|nr:phosphatase PAP2 family protein [Bacteroidota bacterium]
MLILILCIKSLQGQLVEHEKTDSTISTIQSQLDDFKYITSHSFSSAQYPDWKLLAYTGLTMVFILSYDTEYHEDYGVEKEYDLMGLPRVFGNIGTLYDRPGPLFFSMGLTGALYGGGTVFRDHKLQQTAVMMVQSFIITGIFTMALKALIGRARPYVANDPYLFKPFNFNFDSNFMSMPSGHTSSIFALMTVLGKQYDSWYVRIPAYTFALSVALQRMNTSKHWGSDLLIGGAIGYLVGSAVVKRNSHTVGSLDIQPVVNGQGVGLTIQF